MKIKALTIGVLATLSSQVALADHTIEHKLEKQQELIRQQAKAIEALSKQIEENQQAIEATVEAVESDSQASKASKVHIGGYGELHYNNLNGEGGASDKDEIDFHRFVLFFNYEYSDKLRFVSELELEHSLAGDGKPGEVELEQAYIDYDFTPGWTWRTGLFLLPVGILNETHEPDSFYGVERNNVEKNIIPTTWWEGGTGLITRLDNGITLEGFIHSGLNTSADNNFKIRNGRQKVAEAEAEDLATTLAITYAAIPGVTLGASAQYQQDITQSNDPTAGSATLLEAHADIQIDKFGLRALYATWDLDGDGPAAIGADEQTGWYIEPSYRISEKVGVFTRYSTWDNQAGNDSESEKAQTDIGVNYWLHPNVVLKADYQWQDNDNGKEQNGFNLGFGYSF